MALDPAPVCDGPDDEPGEASGAGDGGARRHRWDLARTGDVDQQVAAAVAATVRYHQGGVPPDRQAVLHPPGPATATALRARLQLAGLAVRGPAPYRLDRSAAGRLTLGLVETAAAGWPRAAVCSWLGSAPLRTVAGTVVTPVPWSQLSVRAGVVAGVDQWQDRLGRLAEEDPSEPSGPAQLARLIGQLAACLPPHGPTWEQRARALGALLRLLPGATAGGWPAEQRAALTAVQAEVAALGSDGSRRRQPVTIGELARTLRRRLSTAVWPAVGPGAAAGWRIAGQAGASGTAGLLGATPTDAAVLVAPFDGVDADILHGLQAVVLLGAGAARADATAALGAVPWLTLVELDPGWAGRAEHGWGPAPVVDGRRLAAGMEGVAARRSSAFTRFDGHVGPGAVPIGGAANPVSATQLETYATCPRRHLFNRVLRLQSPVVPERRLRLGAAERGALVHRVLEAHVAERLEGARRSALRLVELAEDAFAEAETAGLVRPTVLWELQRAGIRRDLVRFHREEEPSTPLAAEMSFGSCGARGAVASGDAVVVALPGGREVHFRGSADRVDRAADGSLVVADYKTGRQPGLRRLLRDPVDGGTRLQLPLYALAARQRFGGEAVRACYWLLSDGRSALRYHLQLSEAVERRLGQVVGAIADGIAAGVFPAVPGPRLAHGRRHCSWCDVAALCPADRGRQWRRKRRAAELAPLQRLAVADDALAGTVVAVPVDGGQGS